MAASTCPQGHPSESSDYCDVCGSPISAATGGSAAAASGPAAGSAAGSSSPGPAAASSGATKPCPNCSSLNAPDSLFCEDCGYDFTTGQLPPPMPAPTLVAPTGVTISPASQASHPSAPSDWVAEVWVDPDWYAQEGDAAEPCPSSGPPRVVPLPATGALVGRKSKSRGLFPEIDCGTDTSVSRRQAQLSFDGTRWYLEDLESTNGTYIGETGGPLPSDPIPAGRKHEVKHNERIYVGSWTRLVVRKATTDETSAATTGPDVF